MFLNPADLMLFIDYFLFMEQPVQIGGTGSFHEVVSDRAGIFHLAKCSRAETFNLELYFPAAFSSDNLYLVPNDTEYLLN